MRRTLLLLLAIVCSAAMLVAAPQTAQAISAPTGLKSVGARGFEALTIGWKWSTGPKKYAIEYATKKDFSNAEDLTVARKAARPSGGVQTQRFTGLKNGTRYYFRVASVAGNGSKSGWSGTLGSNTRIRYPSPPDGNVKAVAGPGAGEVTFTWKTAGQYTDYFKLSTATSPFKAGSESDAENYMVTKIDGSKRKYTMSAAETEAAGAGIGTAWTLVWRMDAVNEASGFKGQESRYFYKDQSRVMGMAPTGSGNAIRVASWNIKVDVDNDWGSKRAQLVAKKIKDVDPGIVLLQELFNGNEQVTKFEQKLDAVGASKYALTRSAPLTSNISGAKKLQNRILYDTTRYAMVSVCLDVATNLDCHLKLRSDGGPDWSPLVRMREISSGQEFWVLSLHLANGPSFASDRVKMMEDILAGVEDANTDGLPVIIGGDHNSNQLTQPAIHDMQMAAGYYDAASTVTQVKEEYNTFNEYEYQVPSPFGVSPRIDCILTLNMPGSTKFVNEVVAKGDPFPSDHNMVWADLRLP